MSDLTRHIPVYLMAVLAALWSPLWCACQAAESAPSPSAAHACCTDQPDHHSGADHHTAGGCGCDQHHVVADAPAGPSTAVIPVLSLTALPALHFATPALPAVAEMRVPRWGEPAKPALALTLRAQRCLLTI